MTEITREQLMKRVFQLEKMIKLDRAVSDNVEAEALDLKVLNDSFLRLAHARINKLAKENELMFSRIVEFEFNAKSSK